MNRQLCVVIGALGIFFAGSPYFRLQASMDVKSSEIKQLRAAYDAFNRGDFDAAVSVLDENVLWVEPPQFPGGGIYHGKEEAKGYLKQSRAGALHVISTPEKFLDSGNRIIVFVRARVQVTADQPWQDIRLADVYTFRKGKAIAMRAFADREEAIQWAATPDPSER
jgi:ketosteroid isomerase-like protein